MKTLKFRAWDMSHQDMEYIEDFYWFEESGVHDSEGLGHHANYILMQYTGLKDQDGKEIYEGDIVLAETMEDCGYEYHVVEWEMGGFHLRPIGSDLAWWMQPRLHYLENAELVGNVYENKELLEGK